MGINNATSQFPCPFCKIHFSASKSFQNNAQNEKNREIFRNQMNLDWDLGNSVELNNSSEMAIEKETESEEETESEIETESESENESMNEAENAEINNEISYRSLAEAKRVYKSNNILIRKGIRFFKIHLCFLFLNNN